MSDISKFLRVESARGHSNNPKVPANVPNMGTHFPTGLSTTQFMLMMTWHIQASRMSSPTNVPLNDLTPDLPINIRDKRIPHDDSR